MPDIVGTPAMEPTLDEDDESDWLYMDNTN
jgi:hypothetical protein